MEKEKHYEATQYGKPAEGRIAGALRGGYVYNGYFYASGPVGSFHSKQVENVDELKIYAA